MKYRYGICGAFDFDNNGVGGQSIKTKEFYGALCDVVGKDNICILESAEYKKNPVTFFTRFIRMLKTCRHTVILPAQNGIKIFAPLSLLFKGKNKIHYCVIGGWLPELCKKYRMLAKMLRRFDGIYVETMAMKRALEQQEFENIIVMPNFKKLNILEKPYENSGQTIRLCTFSRVTKEKGIGEAIETVKKLNKSEIKYSLDIYGNVDDNQTEWFETLMKNSPEYVHYCGCVPFNESVETLKMYDLLLFPTYYEGEGFAGTLLDAMAAGLPVVASNWRYNSEIVNERTGFIVETHNVDEMVKTIEEIKNYEELSWSCIEEAKKYTPQNIIKIFIEAAG